jgi:hypothetical protein
MGELAQAMEKAYNIGVYHVTKLKPKMPKDQFIDTYFPGPDMATLFVEYQLDREELYSIYRRSYDSAKAKKEMGVH